MGDKYIYIFYKTVRGVQKPFIVESLDEVPPGVNKVEEYKLERVFTRGEWS